MPDIFQFGDTQSMSRYGDTQSMNSYRNETTDGALPQLEDEVSLRSLPMTQHHLMHQSQHPSGASQSTHLHLNPPRSMSPVSSMSGDELCHGGASRRSQRRRPLLDKQVLFYSRCILDSFYIY